MNGIYVGEEESVVFEDGTTIWFLKDLSQGADDDLVAYDKGLGGPGTDLHSTKLLELAITRIVPPDGGDEFQPTREQIRQMKGDVSGRVRDEVMSRWFPLAWLEIQRLQEEVEEEANSGEPSTGGEDLAGAHPNGTPEPSS